MTPATTPWAPDDDAVPAYEALRRHVLSGATGGGAAGLVVLLRQGVAAWRACRRTATTPSPTPAPAAPLSPDARHAALVTLLLNMVLGHAQETAR